jgi:hypothetical protein
LAVVWRRHYKRISIYWHAYNNQLFVTSLLFFKYHILLRYSLNFFNFVSIFLNHPNIISKNKFSQYSQFFKKSHTQMSSHLAVTIEYSTVTVIFYNLTCQMMDLMYLQLKIFTGSLNSIWMQHKIRKLKLKILTQLIKWM